MNLEFQQSMAVSVVVERRKLVNPWATEAWQVIGVLPKAEEEEVRVIRQDGTGDQFLLGGAELTLHRSDVTSYRYNLAGLEPSLFVALRRDEALAPAPWRVLLVTVAPDEAQKLMDSGDDIVEAVAMPAELRSWAEEFCARFPADEPFEKRRRKNWRETPPNG